jgi:hypothetical protein
MSGGFIILEVVSESENACGPNPQTEKKKQRRNWLTVEDTSGGLF